MYVPPGPRVDGTSGSLRSSLHDRTDLSCRSSPVLSRWLQSRSLALNLPPSCGCSFRSSSSRGGGARRHGPGRGSSASWRRATGCSGQSLGRIAWQPSRMIASSSASCGLRTPEALLVSHISTGSGPRGTRGDAGGVGTRYSLRRDSRSGFRLRRFARRRATTRRRRTMTPDDATMTWCWTKCVTVCTTAPTPLDGVRCRAGGCSVVR